MIRRLLFLASPLFLLSSNPSLASISALQLTDVTYYSAPGTTTKTFIRDLQGNLMTGTYTTSTGMDMGFVYDRSSGVWTDLRVGSNTFNQGHHVRGHLVNFQSGWHTFYVYNTQDGSVTPWSGYPGKYDVQPSKGNLLDNGAYSGTHTINTGSRYTMPFYFNGTSFSDIAVPNFYSGEAMALFNQTIVGYKQPTTAQTFFAWTYAAGSFTEFQISNQNTFALDVWGTKVVGVYGADGAQKGFVYDLATSEVFSYEAPGAVYTEFSSIEGNEISGFYKNSSGQIISFAGTVPEPSALSLLAVGLGGLALIRRRRS